MYPTVLSYQTQNHVGFDHSQKLISALELQNAQQVQDNRQQQQQQTSSVLQNGTTRVAGRYELNAVAHPRPDSERFISCVDLKTGYQCTGQLYPLGRFKELAPLIMSSIEGVLQVIDACAVDTDSMLVIRPAAFGDLHGYLKHNKKLPEVQASLYFRQVVNIIDQAHKHGIVLRDLKLKKFYFTDSNMSSLALSDLEDATIVGRNSYSNDLLEDRHGCPAYVAPEMLRPGSYSGRAADMWSAGIILYTLLVGHYPFFDVNPQILFTKIRSGHYYMPHHISYLARSLISSLLSYDPTRRPTAEAISNHPWLLRPSLSEGLPFSLKQEQLDQTVPNIKQML